MSSSHRNEYQLAKPDLALTQLDALVGAWDLELSVPTDPPTILRGLWTTFAWMAGACFLIWRWGPARPDFPGGLFPAALSVIDYDDSIKNYPVYYFDSRGVYRDLEMSLEDGNWRIWRASPGFSQRFTGTISRDAKSITGFWEKSTDGSNWEPDFHMRFLRST